MAGAILAGGVMCGALAGGWSWFQDALGRSGPLAEGRAVVVPHGGAGQLGAVLAADGVVDRAWLFRAAAWVTRRDGTLHAAEFAFPAHASIREVLAILRTGRPVEHHLTIAEGLTAQQIASVLGHAGAMTGSAGTIAEGALLPQTYEYEYGAARSGVVARATAAMSHVLAAAWAERAPGLPLGGPREALILASIVERETARPEERGHVASVYLNRLRLGMKLQADPTVVYAASHGAGVLDHPLTRTELERDDPFNTYRSAGLPPGPICSPGVESLLAVLHPVVSDDLYFVADGAGGHVFSRTYEAHDVAVAKWRARSGGGARGRSD